MNQVYEKEDDYPDNSVNHESDDLFEKVIDNSCNHNGEKDTDNRTQDLHGQAHGSR